LPGRPAGPGNNRDGILAASAILGGMSTDSHARGAQQASLVPDKPSLDGIEDKWSRRWENSGVVQV
jgi:hypothetical protein